MTSLQLEKLTRGLLIATASVLAVCVGWELKASLYQQIVITELEVIQTHHQKDAENIRMYCMLYSKHRESSKESDAYEPESAIDYN